MTADRLAAFAERLGRNSYAYLADPETRRIVLALCDVAKAAQHWNEQRLKHFELRKEGHGHDTVGAVIPLGRAVDVLVASLEALSAALAEPTPDQKERSP